MWRVESSGGNRTSLAGRYASALFDLARDARQIDSASRGLAALGAALAQSAELKALTTSPRISRADAGRAVAALAPSLGLDPLTGNFLGLLARNGRLGQLGAIIREFERLAAGHRGEISAEVVTARPLDDDQVAALKRHLAARAGREVAIDARVDPAILGGITVRMGSRMIDSSIRTKLNHLAQAMKG